MNYTELLYRCIHIHIICWIYQPRGYSKDPEYKRNIKDEMAITRLPTHKHLPLTVITHYKHKD